MINRRSFLLKSGSTLSVLSAPMLIPSRANAFTPLLIRVALRALSNTAARSLRQSGRRLNYDASQSFKDNGSGSLLREFGGELIKEFIGEFGGNMFSSVSAAAYPDYEDVALKAQFYSDPDFKRARNKYVSGRGGRVLDSAKTFYVFPKSFPVADVESIALDQAMQSARNDGFSQETVAGAMFPLEFDRIGTDTLQERIKYGYEDRGWKNRQIRNRPIHTPTGFGHIKTDYNAVSGMLDYDVDIYSNPNFTYNCTPVCRAELTRFRYRGVKHLEEL